MSHVRRILQTRAVGMLLAALVGCSITGTSSRTSEELELMRNRQRWESAGIHDYEFDFQRTCFCPTESTEQVHIVVREDAIASVTRTRDGQPAGRTFSVWPRVDELFEDVQQRLAQHVERVDVRYDPTYGYPRSIVVDIALMTADDEYALTAGNLRRVP
ncbi:MAG: hypothetical protein DMD35_01800 [Gemmatimonadetes bacterium]|nr:MAG: hypothetical protein DMD35_01800 [Gemmatimonadota bacterium]